MDTPEQPRYRVSSPRLVERTQARVQTEDRSDSSFNILLCERYNRQHDERSTRFHLPRGAPGGLLYHPGWTDDRRRIGWKRHLCRGRSDALDRLGWTVNAGWCELPARLVKRYLNRRRGYTWVESPTRATGHPHVLRLRDPGPAHGYASITTLPAVGAASSKGVGRI